MNKRLLLGTIILLLHPALHGQAEDWNTIKKDNYSIDYPKDWELNESGLMGTSFILLSPLSTQTDQFRENINLLVQDLKKHNLDLDAYVEISERQIMTMITNGQILESERVTNQGLEYHKVIYTGTQGKLSLKFEQYYWVIREDKAYVLTFTCEEAQFDAYKFTGEKIMNSFKLNEN